MCKNGSKGSALVLTLMISLIVMTLTAGVTFYAVAENKQTALEQKKLQAYYIARSGADLAAKWLTSMSPADATNFLANLANQDNDTLSFNNISFGQGSYDLRITDAMGKVLIVCVGHVNDIRARKVDDSVSVMLDESYVNNAAPIVGVIFARDSVTITGNCSINGDIGVGSTKNSAISMWGNLQINNCNIHIPKGANASSVINMSGNVFGYNKYSVLYDAPTGDIYPIPIAPQFPVPAGSYTNWKSVKNKNNFTVNGDLYSDGNIDISGNNSITVNGNLYVNGHLDIWGNTTFKVNGNVYIKDYFKLDGNSWLQCSGSLCTYGNTSIMGNAGLKVGSYLYVYGNSLTMQGNIGVGGCIMASATSVSEVGNAAAFSNGSSFSVLYAPNAEISLSGNMHVRGAVIGNIVDVWGNCSISYDTNAISNNPVIVGGSQVAFEMGYWQ